MENKELVLVIDFGGQYSQLIARRIRECGVYCEIVPFTTPAAAIAARKPRGIVFSGGPSSVYSDGAPVCEESLFSLGMPILGICYGMQLTTRMLGGDVARAATREYGNTRLYLDSTAGIFAGLSGETPVWMSHGDYVAAPPDGFTVTAHTNSTPVAAMADENRRIYGVQFHPDVLHTPEGMKLLRN